MATDEARAEDVTRDIARAPILNWATLIFEAGATP
jgi:hypothetical protein